MELPADIVPMMEKFGRYEYDPQGSGIDSSDLYQNCVIPLYPMAQDDPAGFVEALGDAVLPVGGWSAYGAERAVAEPIGLDFATPASQELLAASLQLGHRRDSSVNIT
jgi:hypothetical protein